LKCAEFNFSGQFVKTGRKNVSWLQFVARSAAGIPEVLRCALRFKNWRALTREFATLRSFGAPTRALGRENFEIQLWDPGDVQTVWSVFCNPNYTVPEKPRTVLDLGANIGTFSIYAAKLKHAEKIIALEPVASTFSRLRRNIESNGLAEVVTCVPQGIGGTIGRRTVYCGVSSPHSSMFYRGDPRFESGRTEEVSITTLEEVFERFHLTNVDVCKADCEGGEVEALLSASDSVLNRIRCITMEYHFPGNISDKTTLFKRLERAGFHLAWHSRIGQVATFVRS
jgi:FkbM family methyltransferase